MSITDQLRQMGWKPEQIATAMVDGKPLSEARESPKRSDSWPGFKSKWEANYAAQLDARKAAGEILQWEYEPYTFSLTESYIVDGKRVRKITYTPDFVVWYPNGTREHVEIKGYRRTKDINRFKQAKDKFRHEQFIMLKWYKGQWERLPY